jgi:hypothetical protein
MFRRSLIICGILSSLLYVAMDIFVPLQWPEYNSASQTVSELSAIGAPTRGLWVPLGFVYALLLVAFGWGVWKSGDGNRPLRVVGVLIMLDGAVSLVWPLAPMHLRQVLASGGATLSDTMHLTLAMSTVLLMLVAMGFGAAAFGKAFGLYSIFTMVTLSVFGALTSVEAPQVEKNFPTPLIGVWERINIGVFLLWIIVLAILLMRKDALKVDGRAT